MRHPTHQVLQPAPAPRRRAARIAPLLPLLAALCSPPTIHAADPAAPRGRAPRGQPIRPPAHSLTNPPPAETAGFPTRVTLPGGVVITNLPADVLPRSPSNTIRLPTTAARRFQPRGFEPISFTVLARFFLEIPSPATAQADPAAAWNQVRQQIPPDVTRLDGQKVALAGFMLPLSLEQGRTREFLLLRTQSACCFGLVPRVNELIVVRLPPPGLRPTPDIPVVAAGTLHLQWIGEGGQLTSVYTMDGALVEPAGKD